jgi:phosphoenolpyruvate synthase/pyruvate phosphate dikinase
MPPKYVLFFDEISKSDLPQVGGKGANLGSMTGAGFPVPGGFCVTTAAYQEFIERNALSAFMAETLAGAKTGNIQQVGTELRQRMQQTPMTEAVVQEIIEAWRKTGSGNAYAVRSSATTEDLAFASFAGQMDTYLNIIGEGALLGAVRNCWASLFTERAILYRMQNQVDQAKVSMSVVVQKMILPEVSGIMFTADPVSGHRGLISVDASYGLGEALVSGLVSPDLYQISKRGMQIEGKPSPRKNSPFYRSKAGVRRRLKSREKNPPGRC